MELKYIKTDNANIFSYLASSPEMTITDMQNYIPIYNNFFTLTKNNYNSINLNNKYKLHEIQSITSPNTCIAKVSENTNVSGGISSLLKDIPVFFKFSPLLDPIKYMVGKYDISSESLLNIPSFQSDNNHKKTLDCNNASYTDGFFSYLSSMILHKHDFIHGNEFYGSFLGKKKDFYVNIYDEVDYLQDSHFFTEHKDSLFYIDNEYYEEVFNGDTRQCKKKIHIHDEPLSTTATATATATETERETSTIIDLKDVKCIHDLSFVNNVFTSCINSTTCEEPSVMYESTRVATNNTASRSVSISSSSCSSRSSNTNSKNSLSSSSSSRGTSSENSSSQSYSTASEDVIYARIPEFPVEIIALEKYENTLDHHILHSDITDKELGSIVMQILMMLITYQKVFHMTHNDLHTNNIMYTSTKKEFLYYRYNDIHYKVPTFGKLYKIIDYGRAIYHFNGKRLCSDSFHKDGDGATQYNCEPYYNKKKPVVEPNYSFDLCRLGCSLFDFFVDELEDIDRIKSPIKRIIINWCKDDAQRNVLYKSNGKERYPDFKLYKMIARTVHNHTPCKVLTNKYFSSFIVSKKKITKNKTIVNIDKYPCYAV